MNTYISKNDSNTIKGVAILLMLFYHLFNRVTDGVVDVWVGGQPLTKFLSTAAYPVPFFLMMSGYGLYYTYQNGRLNLKKNSKRAFRLYLHYWLVMLVFVSIGSFLESWHYPGTVQTVAENIIGINCTYNYETWFLLPYVVLSFLSPLIFKVMDRLKPFLSLAIAFVISYGAFFVMSRYVVTGVLTNVLIVFAITTTGLLFSFIIGASMSQITTMKRSSLTPVKTTPVFSLPIGAVLLIALILLRCLVRLPWDDFYAAFIVLLFLNTKRVGWIDAILQKLGKNSMVMWMVHTYFSIYLFHDFIYGFKYPIVIYLVLVGISYLVAVFVKAILSVVLKSADKRR